MNKYIFVLGNNYKLSIVEILNYFYCNGVKAKNIEHSKEILILDSEAKVNCKNLINKLGGTIKIGTFVFEENILNEKSFEDVILKNINKDKKVNLGFDTYILNKKFNIKIKNLGLTIKNNIKESGCHSRLVVDKNVDILSSVTSKKNNLLEENGFEFLITKNKDNFIVFKIEAVQDFEKYSERDFGRPNRDSNSGMLPPKLCKIMVNISDFVKDKDIKILDPFCGSGTMIMELILLNYKNIIGTDISEKAINDSIINLEWFYNEYNLDKIKNVNIFKQDVENIDEKIDKNSIDLIVTEPYLGPSNLNIGDIKRIKDTIIELQKLYIGAFKTMYKILKENGEIVIIFPVFRTVINNKTEFLKINIDRELKEIGFIKEDYSKLNIEGFDELLYCREDQRIFREINKFKKK